jgi:hypothetical protein
VDSVQVATEAKTWVDFAILVWKDIWGYMGTALAGLAIGAVLPQVKLRNPLKKAPKDE